ncbi:MAG: TonB-dependent receptor [Bacteroidales bacterium]|nr:TonB-dependent receptor [Bacteroidales bacterium]
MKNHVMSLQKKQLRVLLKAIMASFLFFMVIQSQAALQEKKTITGSVKDAETNEPLPGATILEKGTTNGTITDVDGNFTLQVKANGSLQISYVSYKTEEVAITGSSQYTISLSPDVVGVSDVVVIGYGTVKKSDLTGAVSSISSEDIRQNIGSGIDQALQGRTAGVTVTANSGAPGAAPTVRIRGMGTITNPNPFYVIDGIPVSSESVGMLNPGDIESMEVLKDASAAAIYGARAANGVVLITTRRAKAGKSSISVDAYSGVQSIAKKYDIMTAKDWVTIRNAAGQPWMDSSTVQQTDWQDELFRQAKVNSVQLSLLNGNENISSAIIGSYFKQDGIVKGSGYERFTVRVNTASKLKPWLTVGENIGYSHAKQNLIPEQNEWSSAVVQALVMDPTTPVYDANGNHAGAILNNITNPVGVAERSHNILKTQQLLGNVYLEIKPVSWLTFKSSVSTEINNYDNEQFFPIFTESSTVQNNVTTLAKGDYKLNTLLTEQLLTFQKTLFEKHDIQFLLGYTRQQTTYRLNVSSISGVPEASELWMISNGDVSTLNTSDVVGPSSPLSSYVPSSLRGIPYDASMVSYLARLIYSFNNRYDLTASIRRDGSSKFGSAKRWGNFESFALGWKLSEESFFPKNDILNFAKIRVGWGELGNQEIGDYAAYTNVTYGFDATFGEFGSQERLPGGAPTGFANSGIQWETTVQTNIGLDANLFKSKMSLSFDYFNRLTTDMLCEVPVPGVSGIQTPPTTNAGSVSNKGWELNVSYRERSGEFKYELGFNIGHVKNELTKLGKDQPINSASFRAIDYVSRSEVGMPIAYFYGYVCDGLYQNADEIEKYNQMAREATGKPKQVYDNKKAMPGDIIYKDISGPDGKPDGIITSADRRFIGSPHPDLTYGVNVKFEYKNFDLSVFGQGVYGNEVFMATTFYLMSGDAYWNLLNSMKDHWKQDGDKTEIPRLGLSDNNMRLSDRYVKDGSFFRIKNIQLGYTLPQNLSKKAGIERAHIYVSGQNLFSFHNYEGFDPEIGTGRGMLDIGIDRGMYPLAKTMSVGLNLTF